MAGTPNSAVYLSTCNRSGSSGSARTTLCGMRSMLWNSPASACPMSGTACWRFDDTSSLWCPLEGLVFMNVSHWNRRAAPPVPLRMIVVPPLERLTPMPIVPTILTQDTPSCAVWTGAVVHHGRYHPCRFVNGQLPSFRLRHLTASRALENQILSCSGVSDRSKVKTKSHLTHHGFS